MSLAGCIKWLPPQDTVEPGSNAIIDEGCHEHPVIILSTQSRSGIVDILIITSLRGQDLGTRFPNQHRVRSQYLPIAPSPPHPDNGVLLTLADGSPEMSKRSYISTRQRHSIRLTSLRPYFNYQHTYPSPGLRRKRRDSKPELFLSKKSYQTLMKHVQSVETPLLLLPPSPPPSPPQQRRQPRITGDWERRQFQSTLHGKPLPATTKSSWGEWHGGKPPTPHKPSPVLAFLGTSIYWILYLGFIGVSWLLWAWFKILCWVLFGSGEKKKEVPKQRVILPTPRGTTGLRWSKEY